MFTPSKRLYIKHISFHFILLHKLRKTWRASCCYELGLDLKSRRINCQAESGATENTVRRRCKRWWMDKSWFDYYLSLMEELWQDTGGEASALHVKTRWLHHNNMAVHAYYTMLTWQHSYQAHVPAISEPGHLLIQERGMIWCCITDRHLM